MSDSSDGPVGLDPGQKISWWYTNLDSPERDALLRAFDNHHLSMGPIAAELEERICREFDVPFALVTASGTGALMMALLALGVASGDEVIVPDLTWVATAQAAAALGAKVVLIDCDDDLPIMDVSQIEKNISDRTRVIVPVHANGRACRMKEISEVAEAHGVRILEDACKAMFSRAPWGLLGTTGNVGCYSMGMFSLVSVGYGGFAVTRDEALYDKMKLIRDHGVDRSNGDSYDYLGLNFKLSDLLASIGIAQFDKAAGKTEHVREIHRRYASGLSLQNDLSVIPVDVDSGLTPLFAEVRTPHADDLVRHLAHRGITTGRAHPPLHRAKYLDALHTDEDFPNATIFSNEIVILPCGPSQPMENIDRTIDAVREWNPLITGDPSKK